MNKKTIRDVDFKNKRVLVRVDFNVPLKDGKVSDDTRIRASLPTIKYLLDGGGRVLLCSHFGRPKGGPDPKYSLGPAAIRLAELLGQPAPLVPDCVGVAAENASAELLPGQVVLLENVRFHPGEEKNDPAFAQRLAVLADLYVNDAFGSAHRAHASTEGVAHHLPAYAGFLLVLRAANTDLRRPAGPLFHATASSALVLAAVGVVLAELEMPGWAAHGWLLVLGVSAQVIGYLAISISLPRLPAVVTSILLLVQPVLSVGVAALIVDERPSPSQLAGVALVVTGRVRPALNCLLWRWYGEEP